MTDAPKFTNAEKAKEAEREVAMRKQVYGKNGPIVGARQRQIEIMMAIADDYRKLEAQERLL